MIRLENVSKRYQMGDVQVAALDGVSLEIGKGEFVVVLGPSGSGKTTLLNIIGALDVPTDGQINVNGGELSLSRRSDRFKFRRETVSFIFQTFNLFPRRRWKTCSLCWIWPTRRSPKKKRRRYWPTWGWATA